MKILIFLITSIISYNILNANEDIIWVGDEHYSRRENRLIFTLGHSTPVFGSNESSEGISHFDYMNEIKIGLEKKISTRNLYGLFISYSSLNFSKEYLELIKSKNNNYLNRLSLGANYTFTMIKGNSVYLNFTTLAAIDYLNGEVLKSQNSDGFDFPDFGFTIGTGPYIGINIFDTYDINIGGNINFSYYNQLFFSPQIFLSLSKWMD